MRSSDQKIPVFERLMQLQLYSQNFSFIYCVYIYICIQNVFCLVFKGIWFHMAKNVDRRLLILRARCPAVQGPFWHLFLSALSTIAWRNWGIPQTCSRRVATGPYTNLAAALHRDGTVTRAKIRRVYAEGGRLHVPEGLYAPGIFF